MDVGLTHVALPVTDPEASLAFYAKYAHMRVVHRRKSAETGHEVLWITDGTRPFVIVLIQMDSVDHPLRPLAHLGVGCATRGEVDRLADQAAQEQSLVSPPIDSGYPVGYWTLIRDPDGHTLELAHGQEVALAVREGEDRE